MMKPTEDVRRQRKRSGPLVLSRSEIKQTLSKVTVAKA